MREPNPPGTNLNQLALCQNRFLAADQWKEIRDAELMEFAQKAWGTMKEQSVNLMAQELIRRRYWAKH